ncbi:MAG: M67 family metallopeptidase [Thermodesulfobacteriota bacterium]
MAKEKVFINIPKVFLEKMITHAFQEYPLECCGILAGKNCKVWKIFPMKNMERSSSSYFMDPEEQYQVFKEIEQEELELLAIYHSHPHSPAYPSPKDIELAFYPETSMIIISLLNPQKPSIKAFQVKERKVKKQTLKYF